MIMVERKIGGSAGVLNARLPLSQTLPFYILSPQSFMNWIQCDAVLRWKNTVQSWSGLF